MHEIKKTVSTRIKYTVKVLSHQSHKTGRNVFKNIKIFTPNTKNVGPVVQWFIQLDMAEKRGGNKGTNSPVRCSAS